MEVFSIITSDKKILKKFEEFIFNYSKLKFDFKDESTAYFKNLIDNKNEIYYHFIPVDFEEILINYSKLEIDYLQKKIGNILYIIDLQYRDEEFLKQMLNDFKFYINKDSFINIGEIILYSHPFKGIVTEV